MRPSSGKLLRPNKVGRPSPQNHEEEAEIFEDTSTIPAWESQVLKEDTEGQKWSRTSHHSAAGMPKDELRRPASASAKLLPEPQQVAVSPEIPLPKDYAPHPVLDQLEKHVLRKLGCSQAPRDEVNLSDYRKMSYKDWQDLQEQVEAPSLEFLKSVASSIAPEEDDMTAVASNKKRGWHHEVSAILKDASGSAAPPVLRPKSRTTNLWQYQNALELPPRPEVFVQMVDSGKISNQLSSVARRFLLAERGGPAHQTQPPRQPSASRRPSSAARSRSSSRQSSHSSRTPSAATLRPSSAASVASSSSRSRPPSRPATPAEHPTSPSIAAFPQHLDAAHPDRTLIRIQDSTVKFLGFRGDKAEEPAAPEAEAGPSIESALRACPLVRGLGALAVRLLARDCRLLCLRPGAVICTQGSKGDSAFVLAEGQLSVRCQGSNDSEAEEHVGHLQLTGDCVGEITLLVGVPYPTTVRTVTLSHVVQIPASALRAVLREWPSTAQIMAECLAAQRRLEKLEEHSNRPASILIKVLGIKDVKKVRGRTISHLQVSVVTQDGVSQTKSKALSDLTATFSELPVNELFEFSVADTDARLRIALLHRGKSDEEELLEAGAGSFRFQTALEARTMSATLELDQGGTVSVLASVRGMYSMQEMQLIEWLDKHANDLPMLLKCGIRSVDDLADMSHSEVLRAMDAQRLGARTKERIGQLVHRAQAGGGFLGRDARALSTQILRHYQTVAVPTKEPSRPPTVSRWENSLFVKYLVPPEASPPRP